MRYIELSNKVNMPQQMMGTSVCELKGKKSELYKKVSDAVNYCVSNEIAGLDTARDYENEPLLGEIFHHLFQKGLAKRDNLFITTKVGNGQQVSKNMKAEIETSLMNLKLEYVDLWLLHWPLPSFWLENWSQMVDIYKSGKVRAIGIANVRERHIDAIKKAGLQLPHVVQIEHHPFRTVPAFLSLCKDNNIQVEAYSSNCLMLPFVKTNETLKKIALAHNKSIPQVMTRWHIQHGIVPIFSSFNPDHIQENVEVYDFELSEEEMNQIYALNQDYKYHPESLNCPGY